MSGRPCYSKTCQCCQVLGTMVDRARMVKVESCAARKERQDMHRVISSQRLELHRLLEKLRLLESDRRLRDEVRARANPLAGLGDPCARFGKRSRITTAGCDHCDHEGK